MVWLSRPPPATHTHTRLLAHWRTICSPIIDFTREAIPQPEVGEDSEHSVEEAPQVERAGNDDRGRDYRVAGAASSPAGVTRDRAATEFLGRTPSCTIRSLRSSGVRPASENGQNAGRPLFRIRNSSKRYVR
jgi:hypothetical protein